jgi:hypothetical protein
MSAAHKSYIPVPVPGRKAKRLNVVPSRGFNFPQPHY